MPLFRVSRKLIPTKCTQTYLKRALSAKNQTESMYQIEDEYTDTPQYPEIFDRSHRARLARTNAKHYDAIKNVATVEEKIFKLNMPRYYGWKMLILNPKALVTGLLDGLPLAQTLTRTHLIAKPGLDHLYPLHQVAASSLAKQLRSRVEDAISMQHQGLRRKYDFSLKNGSDEMQKEKQLSKHILKHINRIIVNSVSESVPHLIETQMDVDPRLEAFWFTSLKRPHYFNDFRKGTKKEKVHAYERVDRPVQYIGEPALLLRNELPLEPFVPYSDAENTDLDVPDYKYDPKCGGIFADYRHGTSIPGFWTGDKSEFGLLSYHPRDFIVDRPKCYGLGDRTEILHSYGIISSFGWLSAQASYQGFSPYNDITYPLVTQTVLSNGQDWSFYAYQMNTVAMHRDAHDDNKKRNICYYTEPMKLYESIDENGKVIGFNEDVLKTLIQFYLNTPKARENVEMKPYLSKDVKVIADYEETEKRVWLENHYKYLVSNRPRQRPKYEVYLWEKLYKIRNKTRFLDAKRRPFELGINPFNRTLDDHPPEYISRYERKDGYMDKKNKWVKSYYP